MARRVAAGCLVMLAPLGSSVRPSCPDSSAVGFYFPVGTFDVTRSLDDFVQRWYAKHLSAMKEPSLSCGSLDADESYRFTWLRTFHRPIVVRLSWLRDGGDLVAVVLDGAGGYEPGKVAKTVRRRIEGREWQSLQAALTGFWTLPTKNKADANGCDGAQWIIEGRRQGQYHIVDRWTPDDGAYRDLGLLFLKLTGIEVPKADIY